MSALKKKAFVPAVLILFVSVVAAVLFSCSGLTTVTITFNVNGGAEIDPITVDEDAEEVVLPTPVKDGYDFLGWYAERSFTTLVPNTLTGDAVPTGSVTYFAKWQLRTLTITFKAGDDVVGTLNVKYGDEVSADDFPSLENYAGYGWTDESFTALYDRTVTASVSGTPTEPEYTVVYYVKGDAGYETYAAYKGKTGASVDTPTVPSAPADGKDYYFSGWYYDTAGKSKCVSLPSAVSDADVALYAVFVEIGDDSQYLYYEETAGGLMITGLTAIGKYRVSVSIPSSIGGKTVVAIGRDDSSAEVGNLRVFDSAFMQTVIIPSTVTVIGDWAFSDCTALKEVIFSGDAISYIGNGAFAGCTALEEITLPDNVTGIGAYAFAGVTDKSDGTGTEVSLDAVSLGSAAQTSGTWRGEEMALKTVSFGAAGKLSTLGDYAFYNCGDLVSVTLSKVMREFNVKAFSQSGIESVAFYPGGNLTGIDGAVYSADGATLYYYPLNASSEFSMPTAVAAVAKDAFYGNAKIESVVFSGNLVSIGEEAFFRCENLSEANLSQTALAEVGDGAFSDCVSLLSAAFPAGLTSLGAGAFSGCAALQTVSFGGDLLDEIKAETFKGCESLVSCSVPSGVKNIRSRAFYGCSAMGRLRFGSLSVLERVEDYAFADCTALAEVVLPSTITYIGDYAFAGIKTKSSFEISDDTSLTYVTYYGERAFSNTSVVKFTVSANVADNASLGKYVFENCVSLKRIGFSYSDNFDAVPEGFCRGCTAIELVSFTNNVASVGDYAFYGCSKLSEVTFGNVETIGAYAFANCTALKNAGDTKRVLAAKITSVGAHAFENCVAITAVAVPKGLAVLPAYAFYGCSALTDISYDTGSTLETIGDRCFGNCVSLAKAVLPSSLAPKNDSDTSGLVKNPFYGCAALKEFAFFNNANVNGLYVDDGVVYRRLYDGETLLSEKAVYAYPTAKSSSSYTVPNTVSVIDRYAFCGSTVTGVAFAANAKTEGVENTLLVEIGAYAFAESSVAELTVSYRVKSVGDGAFYRSKLAKIVFDDRYIAAGTEGYAIANVYAVYADNAMSVGAYAFSETALASVTVPSTVAFIGDYAFANDYKLVSAVFTGGSNTSLSIGDYAFSGDSGLTALSFPSSVSEIGSHAFYRCFNVKTAVFSSGSEELSLGAYAFSEEHYLYTVSLPDNLASLGEGVFSGDTRLKYVTFGSAASRTAASGLAVPDYAFYGVNSMESVVLPSYITEIGSHAFYETSLTSVSFEGSASDADLVIGAYAFARTENFVSVNFPGNLVSVGESAFSESALSSFGYGEGKDISFGAEAFASTAVTSVTLGSRIKSIGEKCFAETASLVSFSTAGGISEIADGAFYGCSRLVSVILDGIVAAIGSEAFYGSGVSELKGVSVSSVGKNAFTASALREYSSSVSGSPVTIGESAFFGAQKLVSAEITTDRLFTAGDFAFADCSGMSKLSIACLTAVLGKGFAYGAVSLSSGFDLTETDAANASYRFDAESGVLYSADGSTVLFYPAGKKGSSFTLGAEVSGIGPYAFYGSTGLTGVIIDYDGIVSLGENAFGDTLDGFTVYVAADNVDRYKNEWGEDCVSAYSVAGGGFVLTEQTSGKFYVSAYLGDDAEITVKGSVTVGDKTYMVTGIASDAFRNNTVVTKAVIGSGIKTIGNSAFRNCGNLTEVIIGENVTDIKNYAFYGCGNLVTVTFAENGSLSEIGAYAFSCDTALTEAELPEGLEKIGIFAFADDTALAELTFGEGVVSIGNNAFEDCSKITGIAMPSTLETLGSYVFSGCEKLIYVIFGGKSVPAIESNTFGGVIEEIYFFVPSEAEKAYKIDNVWRNYITKIIPAGDICSVASYGNYVLSPLSGGEYKLLAYIGAGNGDIAVDCELSENIRVVSIGEYAFGSFAKNVAVGEGVREIADRAFAYATSLVSVTLPASLTSIGEYAFAYLADLTSVTFADGCALVSIGKNAFYACYGLSSLAFPSTLKTIGNYAFACPEGHTMNLTSVTFAHSAVGASDAVCISSIGAYAFENEALLTTLKFDCFVNYIAEGAFYGCGRLESLYLNYVGKAGDKADTLVTAIASDGTDVFGNCDKISIIVPSQSILADYKGIWNNVYNKSKLVSSEMVVGDGDDNTFIYAYVSNTDTSLTVTVINSLGVSSEIVFPSTVRINSKTYTVVRIGRPVVSTDGSVINGYVIGDCVTKVTIPSSVTEIGADAFRNSKNLTTVEIEDGSGHTSILKKISTHAFDGCGKLVSVTVPKSVTTIDSYAFANCGSLDFTAGGGGFSIKEYDTAPQEGVLSIGDYAFYDCKAITETYIPNQVKSIGAHAFYGCSSLVSFGFSEDSVVTTVNEYAFGLCAFGEITFPASVQTVGNYAFYGCASLVSVYLMREANGGTTSPTGTASGVFSGINNPHIKIYVPEAAYNFYLNVEGWKTKPLSPILLRQTDNSLIPCPRTTTRRR
jgi:uncharacterized repeat protein (TIGR02543 family)